MFLTKPQTFTIWKLLIPTLVYKDSFYIENWESKLKEEKWKFCM